MRKVKMEDGRDKNGIFVGAYLRLKGKNGYYNSRFAKRYMIDKTVRVEDSEYIGRKGEIRYWVRDVDTNKTYWLPSDMIDCVVGRSEEIIEKLERENKEEFVEAVIKLSKEYGLSISHEDGHGAFILEPYDEHNSEWLRKSLSLEDQ